MTDPYLHNLHMQDKFTRSLTDYQIAEAFPDCRDIAKRNIAILSTGVQHYRPLIKQDSCVVHFMAVDPAVKQINRLKRYLQLTEPMRDTLDVSKAKQVPIQSLFDPIKARRTATRIQCCCPFHDDSDPSFVIYLKNNTFNCFSGCGGGDSIDFLMRLTNTSFIESVKRLSQ